MSTEQIFPEDRKPLRDDFESESDRPGASPGCLSYFVYIFALLWILAVTYFRWGAQMIVSTLPQAFVSGWTIGLAVTPILLILPPLALLAWLATGPRFKAAYRLWMWASLALLVVAPVQFTAAWETHAQAILHTVLYLVYAGILLAARRSGWLGYDPAERGAVTQPSAAPWFSALFAGGVALIPWLAWGAFGSLLDLILQPLSALALGFSAAVLIRTAYVDPPVDVDGGVRQSAFFHGLTTGTALLLLAASTGFGFGAMQVILMLALSSMGWLVYELSRSTAGSRSLRSYFPAALLVGLVAAGPLSLIDPDELALVINASGGEILAWALRAVGVVIVIGWGAAAMLRVANRLGNREGVPETSGTPGRASSSLLTGLAGLAWVATIVVYFAIGQPGMYGERLFVIFVNQADVSAAEDIEDYPARRQFVYDNLVRHADDTQSELRGALDRLGIAYAPYYLVNGLEVDAGPLVRLWLESRPEVDRVLANPIMRPLPELPPESSGSAGPPSGPLWNLEMINAPRVWNELGVTGEGIIVGQSDSGVQWDHPELAENYRGSTGGGDADHDYNWFDPWFGSPAPADINGHGTHTIATAVGRQVGVAPGATWYGCVNLGRNLGNPAYYLDCMQFMLAPFPLGGDPFTDGDPALGAHVSNNSWGCPELEGCDPATFQSAVQALRHAGIFFEVSAGNDGPFCETLNSPPALYDPVFTTGAVDSNGELALFSSRGPVNVPGFSVIKPDVVAPGVAVLSAFPNNSYIELDGTSMAGPHVAGVVALMWSANPDLIGDIETTESILAETAQRYTGSVPNCEGAGELPSTAFGYGIVDAYAAVQRALEESQ